MSREAGSKLRYPRHRKKTIGAPLKWTVSVLSQKGHFPTVMGVETDADAKFRGTDKK